MTHRHPDSLFPLVESFFRDYLGRVRNASRHSVLAYRDALRLFFSFVADAQRRAVADLRLEDLTVQQVLDFLDHLEASRHNAVATRNLRLTVLRTFFRHLVRQDPSRGAQYQRVLSLPYKKAPSPVIAYLEPEEVQLVLRQPDRQTANEARDHCLLLFLYNTGARISEALAVHQSDLQLSHPFQVKLHGKGRKERICPLWPETTGTLRRLPCPLDDAQLAFPFVHVDANMVHGWPPLAALDRGRCGASANHVRGGRSLHPISIRRSSHAG